MKKLKALLIVIAVICIGVAVSYPIRYKVELDSNNETLEDLSDMRRRVMQEQHIDETGSEDVPTSEPGEATQDAPEEAASSQPKETAKAGEESPPEAGPTMEAAPAEETSVPADEESPTEQPAPTMESQPEQGDSANVTALPNEIEGPSQDTAETIAPAETAVPTEVGSLTETAAPTEVGGFTETAAPTETGGFTETAAPAETGGPTEAGALTETVTASEITATTTPGLMDLIIDDAFVSVATPPPSSTPKPTPDASPSPTPDRSIRDDAETFKDKVKVRLDVNQILPELRDIYELNHDLVGWLYIEDTNIDYPVVQTDDGKFYLTHDFYGRSNANGQIILEDKCDPYTPSYNLVLSGHHMNSGAMFGRLGKYKDRDYWETHKVVEFDTLMARKRYVVFGAFYSADYDEYEDGFRYSADIQYKMDADMWLGEIRENQIYETGVDVEFGDEFITLTTCDHSKRYDGRFVVVARRIREGERIL